jgi:hypothetical protein
VLEYPLYVLELSSCDFFTFLTLNTSLDGSHFESFEAIDRNMKIIKEFLENDIQVFVGVGEMTKYMREVRRPVQSYREMEMNSIY